MLKKQRGVALLSAAVVIIAITGFAAALGSVSYITNRTSHRMHERTALLYAAEAGLELLHQRAGTITYVKGDYFAPALLYVEDINPWLESAAGMPGSRNPNRPLKYPLATHIRAPGFTGVPIFNPNNVNAVATVDGYVYPMDIVEEGKRYMLVARATQGQNSITLAQMVQVREYWTKWMFFVSEDDLSFGDVDIDGAVHTNSNINFYTGGARFGKFVSAYGSFLWNAPADPSNTSFEQGSQEYAQNRPLPTLAAITELAAVAGPGYYVDGNATIELLGDQIRITPEGVTPPPAPVPLPSNGVVYVTGNITSIQGQMTGKVTIACPGNIAVTGRITYVDRDGDPMYQPTLGGVPVADWSTLTTWDPGYKLNSNFNMADESVLGLWSGQNVYVPWNAPTNMEINAALLTVDGRFYCELDDPMGNGVNKGNLRVLGSVVSKYGGWRASPPRGYALSGGYAYHEKPPPRWPQVLEPTWGVKWEVPLSDQLP